MNTQEYGEGANRKEQVIFTFGIAALLFVSGMALGSIYVYGAMLVSIGA